MADFTTIQVTRTVRNDLCEMASKGTTYNSIILDLIKEKKSQTLAEEPEIPTPEKEVLFNAH